MVLTVREKDIFDQGGPASPRTIDEAGADAGSIPSLKLPSEASLS